jgi:hypothetical protein
MPAGSMLVIMAQGCSVVKSMSRTDSVGVKPPEVEKFSWLHRVPQPSVTMMRPRLTPCPGMTRTR